MEPPFTPYGSWRIVSVDGVPAVAAYEQSPEPGVVFTPVSYGGHSGCNGFGGAGVWVKGRWYGDWPMMTSMGCRTVMEQERLIAGVLASGPQIRAIDDGRLEVSSEAGTLILAPRPADPAVEPAPPPPLLAGRRWDLRGADGQMAVEEPAARLALDADTWTLTSRCGASTGDWRQDGQAIHFQSTDIIEACADDPLHQSMQGLSAGQTGIAVGPNGEMVLGGSGHWLLGWRAAEDSDATARLAGNWQGVSLNGEPLAQGDAGLRLAFGPQAYSVWDGCNRTEGLTVVAEGTLITTGSGVSTLARCDARQSEARAVAMNRPRVAWAEDGNLVLVGEAGTLRLRRLDARPFGSASGRRLQPGQTVILTGVGTLSLQAGNRFTLTGACARMDGEWRGGATPRFSPDPVRETGTGCDLGPGSPMFRARQVLIGDVQAIVDANDDRVLIVGPGGALSGRIRR